MKLEIIQPQSQIKISSTGIQGPIGPIGPRGFDTGTSGTSGVDGTSGISGVDGTSGISGLDGTSGTSGTTGTSGTRGTSGTSGTSGISGTNGTSGTSGVDGTSGTSGISGTNGTSGVDGTSGLTQDISYLATTGSNTFNGEQTISGSVLLSGSLVPSTANGTFTSSFTLGTPTNAWKDLYISQGSIIFVNAVTQATSSFTIDNEAGTDNVKYTSAITASSFIGDGSRLTNLPSTNDWKYNGFALIKNTEQLTFSGDYVLDNSEMIIEGSDTEIEYSPNKYFKKIGKIFIGGNLLVRDSLVINNGLISVGGQVILIGNSQIEGTGTII